MYLTDALRLRPGSSVAFVGAGGKTSALACLLREAESRHPVVVTTSTRIGREQSTLAPTHLILESLADLRMLEDVLGAVGGVLVTGPLTDNDTKWKGPADEVLEGVGAVVERAGGILAIEADGARGKSLKVPAPHEPRIPSFVDVVTPIVGIDVLGTTLKGDLVHRPDDVGRFLGLQSDDLIEVEHVVRVMTSASGSLQGVPLPAEVRALINKAANFEALERAGIIARQSLAGSARVRAVLAGNLVELDAVERSWGRIAAVILAAGGATRLEQPKPLLEFRGRTLVAYAVEAAMEAGLDPIAVVVGHAGHEVRHALEGRPVTVVENAGWSSGQSSSLRLGLANVESNVEGVVFFLADMPFVSARTVGRLAQRHAETMAPVVAPSAEGRRGNPVLFDRRTFPDLKALTGDTGGRALFDRFEVVEVACDERELMDVDDGEDLQRLRSME
ncbi:MAG TPA: selenium cofactor biosynthesis protein YqeC [Anaerolineales bacterium]|nr:selenium cofactor biosynthesis protein YqeC [Anaerolineales bacterium]